MASPETAAVLSSRAAGGAAGRGEIQRGCGHTV